VRVVVARVGRPLGVRGDVLADALTDEPDRRLFAGAQLLVHDSERVLVVESIRDHGKRLCIHFEGFDDRTAAESLTNVLVEIERSPDERPDDPDEFYDDTLLGLTVVARDGAVVGRVTEVIHLPAQDLLAVERDGAPEVLIPFVPSIAIDVDLDERRIVVEPPPGLLDLADEPS
jgi:16S rRNA processing protein RimM